MTTFLKKGSAKADIKTIHAPTSDGGLGIHHLPKFLQALKVSLIKRLATSKSFWVQILAIRYNISICTLQEAILSFVDFIQVTFF